AQAQRDRLAHAARVAGVAAGGDAGRTDAGHDRGIVAAAFAEVAVEIDAGSHAARVLASMARAMRCRRWRCSALAAQAWAGVQGRKRSRAPGRICASSGMSARMTRSEERRVG